MDHASPFAQMPSNPEPIIARVRADLERLSAGMTADVAADCARLADESVRALWDSRVKTFVPVLAFRQARERLFAEELASRPITADRDLRRDDLPLPDDLTVIDDGIASDDGYRKHWAYGRQSDDERDD